MRTRNPNYDRAARQIGGDVSPRIAGSRGLTFRSGTTEAHPVYDLTVIGGQITDNDDGTAVLEITGMKTRYLATLTTTDPAPNDPSFVNDLYLDEGGIMSPILDASDTFVERTFDVEYGAALRLSVVTDGAAAVDTTDTDRFTFAYDRAAKLWYLAYEDDGTGPQPPSLTPGAAAADVFATLDLGDFEVTGITIEGMAPDWFGTPALTLGTANAAGSIDEAIRRDATILAFDSTVPTALGTSAAGSATVAARRDHVHPLADSGTGVGFHGCSAYSGALTIGTGAETGVRYDTNLYDTDNFHFTSNAALTGTVAKTSTSADIVGTGTSFTTELSVNQAVQIPGTTNEIFIVRSIADNTHFTAWQTATASASGQTGTRRNDVFAVPAGRAGYYRMRHGGPWDSNTTGVRQYRFTHNFTGLVTAITGAQPNRASIQVNAASTLNLEITATAYFAEGDYVAAVVRQSSGTDRTYGGTDNSARAAMTFEAVGI